MTFSISGESGGACCPRLDGASMRLQSLLVVHMHYNTFSLPQFVVHMHYTAGLDDDEKPLSKERG